MTRCFKDFGEVELEQASSICASANATLLSPINSAEFSDLLAVVETMNPGSFFAIDGTDAAIEGVWMTFDGTCQVPFLEWAEYQPDNLHNEDCIRTFDGKMNDAPCSEKVTVVCEKSSKNELIKYSSG